MSKGTILCIDDDPDILESLKVILDSDGYETVTASSAEDGLKVFKARKPDLIIVDLMMEEIDAGTQFVRDLRAEGNQAPVYMLSSVGDNLNMTTDTSSLGLSGVLQKPVEPKELLRIVNTKVGKTA
jgi:DNA-binding response OmpR family regulator